MGEANDQYFRFLYDCIEAKAYLLYLKRKCSILSIVLNCVSAVLATLGAISVAFTFSQNEAIKVASLVLVLVSQGYAALTPFLPAAKIVKELNQSYTDMEYLCSDVSEIWNTYQNGEKEDSDLIRKKKEFEVKKIAILSEGGKDYSLIENKKIREKAKKYASATIKNVYGGTLNE